MACKVTLKLNFANMKKSAIILRILGFWNFFQICKIPVLITLKWQAKCPNFFGL